MTEGAEPALSKPPKELLALNLKEEADFRKKVQSVKKRPKQDSSLTPGVVYVAHLPRSLGEKDLQTYFQQFGTIVKLRLAKSKKTGGSKGYAFLEFECDEVAKIVAETMNNYLIRERLIKCELMPPEKVHESLFKGCQRKFEMPTLPATKRYNKSHTADSTARMTEKLLRKEAKLRKRLADAGVDYDFPGFAAQVPKKQKAENADVSTCSDITPFCTPSVLERRKSQLPSSVDTEDEVYLKLPGLGDEDSSEEKADDVVEGEEPSEGDKAD
ncbi:hypothetical protein NHX12_007014 [Muraenolepis orangiensis]|uniref:RRM domain-containing protein n=1 Tax=Muraenolepis orangiensis TaxID=630683 RepID=A0A9Q0IBJ7_9TELE|nr:hypothetical protein NHX12_007014 [Muraenolepis orangiensis]